MNSPSRVDSLVWGTYIAVCIASVTPVYGAKLFGNVYIITPVTAKWNKKQNTVGCVAFITGIDFGSANICIIIKSLGRKSYALEKWIILNFDPRHNLSIRYILEEYNFVCNTRNPLYFIGWFPRKISKCLLSTGTNSAVVPFKAFFGPNRGNIHFFRNSLCVGARL